MKQSEKPAVVAGAFLMTFAAVILTSLVIQLLDFGIASSAFALALSNFGRMLYTVYGISSFLIPVYLFVSAILLYLPGFTKRRGAGQSVFITSSPDEKTALSNQKILIVRMHP